MTLTSFLCKVRSVSHKGIVSVSLSLFPFADSRVHFVLGMLQLLICMDRLVNGLA